ncbi:hypothetical protein GRI43_04780 [Altererythrobacter luteolus]|uniref:Uncharacterized protein n=1 Tax=Pontixanthobacter luteolus TaxID=295089 RepID=A0A6I4UXQ6_9SPHN|nr:hypothetical protein [Pontixanthobacter luteolus]MXP46709.1 hypothetical protein [Pontixanthobacter luteolus]
MMVMKRLSIFVSLFAFLVTPSAVSAQEDKWFVGSHPEVHAAMVRDIDGIFVAIFVAKEPSIYASPLLMETVVPSCDTSRSIEMHSTRAIMADGETASERLIEVRRAVEDFFERSTEGCEIAENLEARFFYRFDDAYLATDGLLVEAGIFPLSNYEAESSEETDTQTMDAPE